MHNFGVCACRRSNPFADVRHLNSDCACVAIDLRIRSETVFLEFCVELCHSGVPESSSACLHLLFLAFVELAGLDLSLVLELGHDVLLGPSHAGGEVSHAAELSMCLHSQDFEGLRDNHSLLLVIGEWNSFEYLQSAHGCGTSWSLVRGHASENLPEDA